MTSTAVQQSVSTEDLKQAIYALVEEKNSEFLQFIAHKLEKKSVIAPKKTKKKTETKIEFPPKKERIPYSEMPFWKANPHLKPHVLEGKGGLSKDFWDALHSAHEAFKDVSDEEWDEVLEDLKNDR
jgi:hypothetical protein